MKIILEIDLGEPHINYESYPEGTESPRQAIEFDIAQVTLENLSLIEYIDDLTCDNAGNTYELKVID